MSVLGCADKAVKLCRDVAVRPVWSVRIDPAQNWAPRVFWQLPASLSMIASQHLHCPSVSRTTYCFMIPRLSCPRPYIATRILPEISELTDH